MAAASKLTMKKITTISLVISSLALLGAGCAGPTKTTQTSPRQDFPFVSAVPIINTTNWKTFNDQTAGISFKYPATWPTPKFKEVTIDLGIYGSIDLTSQKWLTQNYEGCLKKQEEAFCQKEFNHTPTEFAQLLAFVSGKNSDLKNYQVGCNAIGGEPIAPLKITHDITRTVYFCGYDASIDNYYYYAPTLIGERLAEFRLPLFPRDSAINAWATAESGGLMATNFETFTKNLNTSLKNQQPDEPVAHQLAEFDAIVSSIQAL